MISFLSRKFPFVSMYVSSLNQRQKKQLKRYLLRRAIEKRTLKKKRKKIKNKKSSNFAYKLFLLRNVRLKSFSLLSSFLASQKKKSKWTHKLRNFFLIELINNFFSSFYITFTQYAWQAALSLSISFFILAATFAIHETIFKDLPAATALSETDPFVSTTILDRNGEVLFRFYEDENRTILPLSQIPPSVIAATISIEDQDFYNHHGFSLRGILRAFGSNISNDTVQGGSTLTQQLVKNRLLSPEKTISRKIKELILAVLVEGTYTKDEILEMYLNQVAYGGSAYGIEAASLQYFGKHAEQLSLAESALLAGLPAAPSVYSPFGSNPEFAFQRQQEVLRRMVEEGYITLEQAQEEIKKPLAFRENVIDIKAPHFVMYIRKILADQYGEDMVTTGGLEVRTTLDLKTQENAQAVVSTEVEKLAALRVNNGAALVTKPSTGEVLAMVGSKNYFDFENDGQVNVALRPRQPGSSIKPLTYAIDIEKGDTASTYIDDTPITYNLPGSPPYKPQNYDGKFHGRVTLREALASSYNVPAVKTLAKLGVSTLIDKGEEMGISTWKDRNRFGLSLTLGGGEVLMTEMAQVYGTFANQGSTVELNPILEVKNFKSETLYRNRCALDGICNGKITFSPATSYTISHILSDNKARTPAFGPYSTLNIPNQEVAVKTGTTNNLRDNWTIGYTSDYLVSVWVGNNDNTPMSYVASGITGASPIWSKIIRSLLDEENPHTFAVPSSIVKVGICPQTKTLTCNWCQSATVEEIFIRGREPKINCDQIRLRRDVYQGSQGNRDRILEGRFISR